MRVPVPIADAARICNVTERTMRRWVNEGKVRSWVVSERRRYVDLEHAIDYNSQRVVAGQPDCPLPSI